MSKRPTEFMEKYNIDSDEIWEVRRGGVWAVKHSALERVATELGIKFELPQMSEKDSANGIVAMLVVGKMDGREEWSIGEASPANNKNAYPYAMAEKRAKDRVILKLLNSHGALYSEAEADEFQRRENPHVTRPTDIVPATEYDENGVVVDNIPDGDERIEQMPKAKARADYAAAQNEIYAIGKPALLLEWGERNKNRIATYPADWREILRGQFSEHLAKLRIERREGVA